MNLKALALSSVLAIGGLVGGMAPPAEAATCWFEDGRGGLAPTHCPHDWRTNNNGHRVVDVVDHEGTRFTLVFWIENDYSRGGDVEIIGMTPNPIRGTWEYDRDGDRRIYVGDFEMAIRF